MEAKRFGPVFPAVEAAKEKWRLPRARPSIKLLADTFYGESSREFNIPFLELYGACSTSFEGLALAAMLPDGGFADNVIDATIEPLYGTAERQCRSPIQQGTQRPMPAKRVVAKPA